MQAWVIFLRGINVGGKHIVPMKKLREILDNEDFSDVQSYIQSGNVLLKSPSKSGEEIADAISGLVETEFGFHPGAVALRSSDLLKALDGCPYPAREEKAVHYYFMANAPKAPDLDRIAALAADGEEFKLADKVFYLHAPNGIGRSKLAAVVEKRLGEPATARNGATVGKIAEMVRVAG